MLQCCAGICGSSFSAPQKVEQGLRKPVDLNEPTVLDASAEYLIERFGMQLAPPNDELPKALVTPDFRKNAARVLLLVPSVGAPFGAWDTDLPEHRGASVPIIQWALANQYAIALFSAAALEASPAYAWDQILFGSPAHHVVTLVAARGALDIVHAAMAPIHEILYSRCRISRCHGILACLARPRLPLRRNCQRNRRNCETIYDMPRFSGQTNGRSSILISCVKGSSKRSRKEKTFGN